MSSRTALLVQSSEQRRIEQERADQVEEGIRVSERESRRVFWQCVGLTFCGVPIYAWSWLLTEPGQPELAVAVALFVSYALPFFRWLAFVIRRSEAFD